MTQQANPFDAMGQSFNALQGAWEVGEANRDKRTRTNALAAYSQAATPEAQQNALTPLVALGDFETLSAARQHREHNALDSTRRYAGASAGAGRYAEAANTAAGAGQVELAQQFMQLDRGSLDAARSRGERGAAAVYSALQLPADQRAAYIGQHRELASELGVTPEQLASIDWTNDAAMRAVADQWQDASKLAGDVSLQRFGDQVQTVRTGPTGSQVLDSREIPETRAEQTDRRQVDYREQTDQRDFGYRQGRDQADDKYRDRALEVRRAVNSTGDVVGPVLAKVAASGEDALTEGERLIFDRYQQGGQQSGGFGMGVTPPPADAPLPSPASGPAPQPAPSRASSSGGPVGSRQNPARPSTPQEAASLPSGAFFVDPSGTVRQRP